MSNPAPIVPVEKWKAEAQRPGGKVLPVQRFLGDVAGEAQADGLVPIVMSTDGEDRAGDTVNGAGWDLTDYIRNPVILWSHDQSIPTIGIMVGLTTGPLRGSMKFTPRDVNPFGDMIGGLYRNGFLKAGSVGFQPLKWAFNDAGGVTFERQSLLEFSACNVPMNADALTSAKSLGLDVELFLPYAEKVLDGDEAAPFWMPAKQAMTVYRSLGARVVQVPASAQFDPAPLLAELKRIGSAVEDHGRTLAALKAAPPAVYNIHEAGKTPAPTPKRAGPSEATLKAVEALISKRVAALTGAVVDE